MTDRIPLECEFARQPSVADSNDSTDRLDAENESRQSEIDETIDRLFGSLPSVRVSRLEYE